jgi:Ketopantoate reductase PanE/ApbA
MRILVYGAGVQGSLYGAKLHEAGHKVALLRLLRTLGFPPTPLNLRAIFTWMPRGVTIAYWRRLFGSARGQYYFAEHARVAWAEMKMLSEEVRAVLSVSATKEPAFVRLCAAIDSYAATQMGHESGRSA